MMYERLINNLKFVVSREDFNRLNIYQSISGDMFVKLDLHGLSCKQGKRLVKNIININKNIDFCLILNHGYNQGDSLKHMINESKWSDRVISKNVSFTNPGITMMKVVA